MKKMILRRYFMLMAVLTLIISSVNVQNVDASNSKRHEYWWMSTNGMQAVGPEAKPNKIKVKIKKNKIKVTGKPINTTKNTSTIKADVVIAIE